MILERVTNLHVEFACDTRRPRCSVSIEKRLVLIFANTVRQSRKKQDAVGAYIWAWLFLAYVKFVMCVRDMWVVQWYCVFEGLVEMCEVVGMELYWKLIAKMVGLVCEVVTGFLRGCFYWMLVIESNSVNSGTEVLIENVCIK